MSELEAMQSKTDDSGRTMPFRYAIVDLATAGSLRPLVDLEPKSTAISLFAENQPRALLHVGPWLIRLSKAPEIQTALSQFDKHVAWGYYLHSTFDILSLRQSLRYFNLVRISPDQKEVLFRYWDPRVIRVFMDVASRDQRRRFFQLIEQIDIGSESFSADFRALGRGR